MSPTTIYHPYALNVVHPIAVLAEPSLGAPVVALLDAGAAVTADEWLAGFAAIRLPGIPRGFVPAAVCQPFALGAAGTVQELRIGQAIRLYGASRPGAQRMAALDADPADSMLAPGEYVLLLGRYGDFVLVQRSSGQLGYIPAAVVGMPTAPDVIIRIGALDLGWLGLGVIWFASNWLGLHSMLEALRSTVDVPPYGAVALVLPLVVACLWLRSAPRIPARSFAIGTVAAAVLLHLLSDGRLMQ